jgi:hypothetical protein
MSLIERVTETSFIDTFHAIGRGEQFSFTALRALYEYFDMLSEDIGEPIEFDPIAICCDFYECNINEVLTNYEIPLDELDYLESLDPDHVAEVVGNWLRDRTQVLICEDDLVLYQAF